MPNMISFGVMNVNTPQQNAGVFVGQVNMTGWDANQKMDMGHGGTYGIFCFSIGNLNYNFDGFELIDGAIADQDIKGQVAATL